MFDIGFQAEGEDLHGWASHGALLRFKVKEYVKTRVEDAMRHQPQSLRMHQSR